MKKLFTFIFASLFSLSVFAHAETNYPKKNITLIVPFGAGGGTDTIARKLASIAEKDLGKSIVVVNRTGGAGAVGMTAGAKSKNDGYTLTMVTREIVSLPILGLSQVTMDDFEPVILANFDPAIVLVNQNSAYNNIGDLIAAAKAEPKKIKFASTAQPNFYALTLEKNQDIQLNHIPFNGAAETIPAVLGGHADFTIVGPGEGKGQLDAGTLKALGIMSEERIAGFDDVATLKEQSVDVTSGTWRGIAVPKGTDAEIIAKLSDAFTNAVNSDEFKEFMAEGGFFIRYLNSADFKQFATDDTLVLSDVLKDYAQ